MTYSPPCSVCTYDAVSIVTFQGNELTTVGDYTVTIDAISHKEDQLYETVSFTLKVLDPCYDTTFAINSAIFSNYPIICNVGFAETVEAIENSNTNGYVVQSNPIFVGVNA